MKTKFTKGTCELCGRSGAIEYHHIIPKSMGGEATIGICPLCHMKLTAPVKSELTKLGIRNSRRHSQILIAIATAVDSLVCDCDCFDAFYNLTGEGYEAIAEAVEAVL